MDTRNSIEHDETYIDITERYSLLPEILTKCLEGDTAENMIQKMERIIEYSQNEIDSICSMDTKNMLNCMNSLSRLSSLYSNVKNKCAKLNEGFGSMLEEYKNSLEQLIKEFQILRNITMTTNLLIKCLPVIEINETLTHPTNQSQYPIIIDACNALETTCDPYLYEVTVVRNIIDKIPNIRKTVKMDAVEHLKTFLNKSLENFSLIGKRFWSKSLKSFKIHLSEEENLKYAKAQREPTFMFIDFDPIYWYVYIAETFELNEKELKFYMNQRVEQLNLIFNPQAKINQSIPIHERYEALLYNVVGYFAVEHFILHSVRDFISKKYIDDSSHKIAKSILISISNSLNSLDEFSKLGNLKTVLLRFDRIMESLGVMFNTAIQCNSVFSAAFFKLMGKQIKVDDYALTFEDAIKSYTFESRSHEVAVLGILSTLSPKYPKTIKIPRFIDNIIEQFTTAANINETTNETEGLAVSSSVPSFESIICFSDITINLLSEHFHDNKTFEGNVVSYYNIQFLKHHISEITANVSNIKENHAQLVEFHNQLAKFYSPMNKFFQEKIRKTVCENILKMTADYNPASENTDVLPSISQMVQNIDKLFQSLMVFPSKFIDELVEYCSFVISDSFINFLTSSTFTSCNKNFLCNIMAQVNFTKVFLMENGDQSTHKIIERDFEELKQTLNLIIINDWSVYFDNYGLSFSNYNKSKTENVLKIVKKLHTSNTSVKSAFSKLFAKEKTAETNLEEIITSLQKLILKNTPKV